MSFLIPTTGGSIPQPTSILYSPTSAVVCAKDVSKLKSSETSVPSNGGQAYDFAIFGLSIAAAAIILSIIALVKRK